MDIANESFCGKARQKDWRHETKFLKPPLGSERQMGLLETPADTCLVQTGKTEPIMLVRFHPEYQRSNSQKTPFTQYTPQCHRPWQDLGFSTAIRTSA